MEAAAATERCLDRLGMTTLPAWRADHRVQRQCDSAFAGFAERALFVRIDAVAGNP